MAKLPVVDPDPTVDHSLGVNVHSLTPSAEEIVLLRRASLLTLRTDFSWEQTERHVGQYAFSAQERFLDQLRDAHLRCIFVLDYSNALYGADGKPPYTAKGREAFARWAAAAMHHFGGRGVLWEIWNEPNGKWFWPNPSAQDYSRLVQAVGRSARQTAPGEFLIGPALYGADLPFFQACCNDGCLSVFDAVTIHPYRSGGPESAATDYQVIRRIIARTTSSPVPLLDGEWGYQTKGPTAQHDRAKLLVRMFLSNLASHIPLSIWYDWMDDGEAMGLVRQAGGKSQTTVETEPGYEAVKRLVDTLGPFKFYWRLDAGQRGEDFAYSFRQGNQLRYVAWTTSSSPREVSLPVLNGNYQLVDSLGEHPTLTASARSHQLPLLLTDVPVYIVPDQPK